MTKFTTRTELQLRDELSNASDELLAASKRMRIFMWVSVAVIIATSLSLWAVGPDGRPLRITLSALLIVAFIIEQRRIKKAVHRCKDLREQIQAAKQPNPDL